MKEILFNNSFFGMVLTVLALKLGECIFKKYRIAILNPMLLAILFIIGVIKILDIPLSYYTKGGDIINFFINPATVCLAIPIYKEIESLKKHYPIILVGAFVGSITAIISVVVLGRLLNIEELVILSIVPKSITTPIGIELSKILGGNPPITVFAIVVTGISGNLFASTLMKMLRVESAVARGLGIGVSSHAVGTTKAIEMGEVEGAMSGLSIVIAGIVTILIAPIVLKILLN